MFGDLFLSSCPGMGKDLLGDIQIIKDLNIKCLISLVEHDELNHLGAKYLFKELDKNNIPVSYTHLTLPTNREV